jgi:hypothetical protein
MISVGDHVMRFLILVCYNYYHMCLVCVHSRYSWVMDCVLGCDS